MLDSRTNLSTEVLREIDEHFGSLLARSRIRNNVKLAEAPSFGRTIFEHAPDSNGARDYEAFASEFLTMIGMASTPAAAPPVTPPRESEPPPLAADASA
jgi:cellulose biosynthesis protein BcsQ